MSRGFEQERSTADKASFWRNHPDVLQVRKCNQFLTVLAPDNDELIIVH